MVPSGNGGITSVDDGTLEEASGHIIKATCSAKEAAKTTTIRIENFRIFNYYSNNNSLTISFAVKKSRDMLKISSHYQMAFTNISIFTNVPADQPIWFVGQMYHNTIWLTNVEFHVHSEDNMKFLLG